MLLFSQGLLSGKKKANSLQKTHAVIRDLSYIQIDTISVIQRAHHHTIWNRNSQYQPADLDQLIKERKVFEYWSHAAAYLPMRDYRFSLIRKSAYRKGKSSSWYPKDKKLMKSVLAKIAADGPMMLRDFEDNDRPAGVWTSSATKKALTLLYMQGDLMICHREKFHKVYEVSERVLPSNIDTSIPTPDEYARFLIRNYLKANGIGKPQEITYLLRNAKTVVNAQLNEMLERSELCEVKVQSEAYYALSSSMDKIPNRTNRNLVKILSPFDNLVIQRKRLKSLFGFDYLLECYVPKAKRIHGYFTLPVLWGDSFVARLDCKAERKESILRIHQIWFESNFSDRERFVGSFCKEIVAFAKFNDCHEIILVETSPKKYKAAIRKELAKYC